MTGAGQGDDGCAGGDFFDDLAHAEQGFVFDSLGDAYADDAGGKGVCGGDCAHGVGRHGEDGELGAGIDIARDVDGRRQEDVREEERVLARFAEGVGVVFFAAPEADVMIVLGEQARECESPAAGPYNLYVHWVIVSRGRVGIRGGIFDFGFGI